jgi:mannosyltransferase
LKIARAFVLVLALAVRLIGIGRFSLGNDEIQEVRFAKLPLRECLWKVADDKVHPPLDYLLQRALTTLGVSDDARRLPAVAAGVGTVALLMLLATRWFGGAAGLAAGAILALSPIHVRYSQEVRPYALGLFLVVASLAALDRHRRTRSSGSLVLWMAAVLASAYTLYFAGIAAGLVGVIFIAAYRRDGLERAWKFLPIAALLLVVGYLPWLRYALAAVRRAPPAPREEITWRWAGEHLEWLGTGDWQPTWPTAGSLMFWLLVAIGLGLAGKRREKPAVVCALWLVLGLALQILLLQVRPHFPAVRYYLPSWLAAVFLAGFAAGELFRPPAKLRSFTAVAMILVFFFDAETLRAYYDYGRPSWDRVASDLRAAVTPGQRVVAANWWTFRNLGYYWSDRGMGAPGIPLEEAGPYLEGPAWVAEASCLPDPEVAIQIAPLLRTTYPYTNHCNVYFLPAGTRVETPRGYCSN